MGSHSRFSPSSFERWSECPGSLNLIDAHPEILPKSSKAADEGTRLHGVAEQHLVKGSVGGPAGDWEAVKDYVLYVRKLLAESKDGWWLIEKKLSLEQVVPDMFGTADAIVVDPGENLIHVVDYKSGSGVPVEVEGNTQLKIYALGAVLTLPNFHASHIRATIVQPRCFHPDGPIRSETYSAMELIDFWEDVRAAAERTKDPQAVLVSGSHCRWCPVASVCSEVRKAPTEVAKSVFTVVGPGDSEKDISNLSTALGVIPQLEAWIAAIRERAYREACGGKPPAGFKLVEKRAHRKWERDEAITAKLLDEKFGISPLESYERKLKSPAQIEKLCNPEGRKALGKLVKVESTGSTLVPVSDPRPEVLVATAQDVFGLIENEEQ